jgi:hypothetical protein
MANHIFCEGFAEKYSSYGIRFILPGIDIGDGEACQTPRHRHRTLLNRQNLGEQSWNSVPFIRIAAMHHQVHRHPHQPSVRLHLHLGADGRPVLSDSHRDVYFLHPFRALRQGTLMSMPDVIFLQLVQLHVGLLQPLFIPESQGQVKEGLGIEELGPVAQGVGNCGDSGFVHLHRLILGGSQEVSTSTYQYWEIHDILVRIRMRIRILGSVSLTKRSGC